MIFDMAKWQIMASPIKLAPLRGNTSCNWKDKYKLTVCRFRQARGLPSIPLGQMPEEAAQVDLFADGTVIQGQAC